MRAVNTSKVGSGLHSSRLYNSRTVSLAQGTEMASTGRNHDVSIGIAIIIRNSKFIIAN